MRRPYEVTGCGGVCAPVHPLRREHRACAAGVTVPGAVCCLAIDDEVDFDTRSGAPVVEAFAVAPQNGIDFRNLRLVFLKPPEKCARVVGT